METWFRGGGAVCVVCEFTGSLIYEATGDKKYIVWNKLHNYFDYRLEVLPVDCHQIVIYSICNVQKSVTTEHDKKMEELCTLRS